MTSEGNMTPEEERLWEERKKQPYSTLQQVILGGLLGLLGCFFVIAFKDYIAYFLGIALPAYLVIFHWRLLLTLVGIHSFFHD